MAFVSLDCLNIGFERSHRDFSSIIRNEAYEWSSIAC